MYQPNGVRATPSNPCLAPSKLFVPLAQDGIVLYKPNLPRIGFGQVTQILASLRTGRRAWI